MTYLYLYRQQLPARPTHNMYRHGDARGGAPRAPLRLPSAPHQSSVGDPQLTVFGPEDGRSGDGGVAEDVLRVREPSTLRAHARRGRTAG